jgi:hypothetical protein
VVGCELHVCVCGLGCGPVVSSCKHGSTMPAGYINVVFLDAVGLYLHLAIKCF